MLVIVCFICLIYAYRNRKWLGTDLYSNELKVEDARMEVRNTKGDMYVVDRSSSRNLKINQEDELEYFIPGGGETDRLSYAVLLFFHDNNEKCGRTFF